MLNPPSKAAVTRVVGTVGALVALCAVLILATSAPDLAFAHDPDPAIYHIHYDENGEGPVATFTSEDPEGAEVDWDVTGLDAADFEISSTGVLTFMKQPNYEMPTDRGRADVTGTAVNEAEEAGNREYLITVRATEMRGSGVTRRALSMERDVTIVVDNVDEPGMVELQWLEPEVHTQIMATLTDDDYPEGVPDGVTVTWTWYTSKVSGRPSVTTDNHWTDVTSETDTVTSAQPTTSTTAISSYIPLGIDADLRADDDPSTNPGLRLHEGKYLRAMASYDGIPDGVSTGNTGYKPEVARGMSDNPVRAERTTGDALDENASPDFEPDTITIPMYEDADVMPAEGGECDNNQSWCVGEPVVAKDPNRQNPADILTYELVQPANREANRIYDDDFFTIDKATGQIKLVRTLDYEEGDGRDYAATNPATTKAEYEFQVRATDPSGDTAVADITVEVMDRNDAPMIYGMPELRVMEQDSDDLLPLNNPDGNLDKPYTGAPGMPERGPTSGTGGQDNTYTASDEDTVDQISWSLGGEDGDKFILSADGVAGENEPRDLMFKPVYTPDFEAPTDANGDNVYKLTVIAWDRTPGYSDRKMDEMAVTVIVDNAEETGRITLETENGVGNEPVLEMEWEPFVDKNIIAAVDDPDQGLAIVTWQWSKSNTGNDDDFAAMPGATTATYTPTGNDEGDFLRVTATYLDAFSGQMYPDDPDTTHDERVVENPTLDAKDPVDGPSVDGLHGDMGLYRVTATSAYAVRVEDIGQPGPDVAAPPVCPDVTFERSVGENAETGTFVGAPLGDDAMCENMDEGDSYSLVPGVRDNDYFSITMSTPDRYILNLAGSASENDANPPTVPAWPQITVGSIEVPHQVMMDPPLDYEAKGGAPFIVTVTATNDDGEDTFNVSITLTDLNESPWFNKASRDDASTMLTFMENSMDLVATYRATDPDMEDIVWEVTGRDADDFTIVDGVLRFMEAPDYEKPTARVDDVRGMATDGANTYMITVRAIEEMAIDDGPDRSDEVGVTVMVTNEDETGKVTLDLLQPEVGTALTATIIDPDGEISSSPAAVYQWYRGKFDSKPALVSNPDAFTNVDDRSFIAQWETISGIDVSSGIDASYTPQGRTALAKDADNATPEELTQRASHPTDTPGDPAVDEYRYLLLVATYRDPQDTDLNKTAIGTSAYAVRRDVHDDNNSSVDFGTGQQVITLEVFEDMAVKGGRVGLVAVADEDDEGDVISYELMGVSTTTGVDCQGPNCGDVDFFIIDKATGEISIEKDLDHEADDGRNYTGTPTANPPTAVTAGEYIIIVRAMDPSGEIALGPNLDAPNIDDVQVKVKVKDRNDAPVLVNGQVGDADDLNNRIELALALAKNVELSVDEADSSKEEDDEGYYTMLGEGVDRTDENLFRKIDHDAGDAPKEWLLERPDGSHFHIGTPSSGIGRIIQFINPPNYEAPQDEGMDNVYNFDVVVIDNDDARGRIPVRVEVMNVNEKGMLSLSPEEPTENQMVTATLDDPDGVKSITSWMWEKSGLSTGGWTVISGATTDTVTGEVGDFLRVTAEYRDGWSAEDDPVTERMDNQDNTQRAYDERNENDPRSTFNERPTDATLYDSDERLTAALVSAVRDPDVPDTPSGETGPGTAPPPIVLTRHVYENVPGTGYVGDPILGSAEEAKGYLVEDSGDGQYFRLADTISTAYADSQDEDYTSENQVAKPGQIAVHWDPVPALDKEADKNIYTITVRDPNAPRKSPIELTIIVDDVNEAPSEPERLIGGLAIGGTTSIRIDEGEANLELGSYRVVGGVPGETPMWSLSGTDASMFTIDANGMLSLNDVLDYEDPMDMGPVLNELQVTVELTVGDDSTSTFVTVTVVNIEERGTVTLMPEVPATGAEVVAELTDPDGNITGLSWQWSKSMTMDGEFIDIDGATMMTYTPVDMDDTYYLRAKAMYTDGHGSGKTEMATTTGMVTTVQDQEGMVTLSSMIPMVGVELAATLTDDDMVTEDTVTWQWSKSMTMNGTFVDIDGATMMTYTPVAADDGYYLMAEAMYTDGHGSGKMAMATSANAVTAGDPLVGRYDANNNGEIEKSEVIAAINDYLFPPGGVEIITKAEVIRLINMYLFPNG